jgi:NADPH-dependent 2,4-dienoyl-CoA reductase/sulfur reductase-like enzyme/rhodanese-related sulfurtransferase
MQEQNQILIIGGVACGPKVASRLKRLMPEARITVVERGNLVSYGACGLPYFVEGLFPDIDELQKTPVGIPRNPPFFEKVKGVEVRTQIEALSIDRKEKRVKVRCLTDGREEFLSYDKLVLATGGAPVKPPVPGIGLKNVWFMTHPSDAESLDKEINDQSLKNAVLVGAGFIGMEMAEALVRRGLNVTIVEMMDQVMPGLLDPEIAALAAKPLLRNGVNLVLSEQVVGISGTEKAVSVKTDRREIPADLVVVAVGTQPNTQLAKAAGLHCNRGIVVNAYGQTNDPDIYAGGDCAENHYVQSVMGQTVYVPLGSTANKNGRVIANHIAGLSTPFSGISCTSVVRVFDHTVGRTGLTEKMARAIGLPIETVVWAGPDMPHYMAEARPLVMKMIVDRKDRKLLGLQVTGMGNGAKRLDVAAAMLLMGASAEDLADVDFGYAPPFSPPLDPLAVCAHVMINKLDGIASGISADEAVGRMAKGNCVLLDVRTPAEVQEVGLPYESIHIPLGALRARANELPKDRDILTFCKVSMRGYEAQRILNAAGFNNVSFIEGGIVGWPYDLRVG